MNLEPLNAQLLADIRQIIEQARQRLQQTVNSTMVQTYWSVGRLIVEHEQQGQERAAYGKQQLQQLSEHLTREFGKGFDTRNLRNMRAFYLGFPIWNAVRTELTWTQLLYSTRAWIVAFLSLSLRERVGVREIKMAFHALRAFVSGKPFQFQKETILFENPSPQPSPEGRGSLAAWVMNGHLRGMDYGA